MGALAYMTGPLGRPLRAGSSVVDLMGGTMGVVGILAALRERDRTGKGQIVKSGLFESTVFMMGQHMASSIVTNEPVLPMPEKLSAWGIYEIFDTSDQRAGLHRCHQRQPLAAVLFGFRPRRSAP